MIEIREPSEMFINVCHDRTCARKPTIERYFLLLGLDVMICSRTLIEFSYRRASKEEPKYFGLYHQKTVLLT